MKCRYVFTTTYLVMLMTCVQEDMTDPAKWAAQSQEQQTSRARQLSQDERQCRSYLTLARETVDMFYYLTQGIQEPFLRPELADRLACMLDAVLEQLTNGPKCKYVVHFKVMSFLSLTNPFP